MRRNDLHPETLPRRLRFASLLLDSEADPGRGLVDLLRQQASHEDTLAEIWAARGERHAVTENNLHVIWQHRRNARRLRELADAIERDLQAGPWINMDQPFVHLDEAAPASQPEEIAH